MPRAVHRLAESLIHQVTRRQEKEYLPRPEDGAVDRFSRDGYLRTEYEILKTAIEHIEQGKTVMFLASCAYMLRPLITMLRKHGIPFHNPYRRSNGFWNPLRIGKRASTPGRILSLLDHSSLNIDTFNSIYVLMGHALPEDAQSPPVQRAGFAPAGIHPEIPDRREEAYPSGSVSFGFSIRAE